MLVSTRGNWGAFVPGDPSSGVNQRLRNHDVKRLLP